jgi:V8-like Glu-specific endopeptidase
VPRHRRAAQWLAAPATVAVSALVATALTSQTAAAAAPQAVRFKGTPAVGALFYQSKDSRLHHFCTAAVVHSKAGNLLITAAHCMDGERTGPRGNVLFAPGFHDGKFPYGRWRVLSVLSDGRWRRNHNPNDDVAFLVVAGNGHRIQRATGAETVQTWTKLPQKVRVIGYPNRRNWPVSCTAQATRLPTPGLQQLVFRCGGYTNGTSGGPFLMNVSRRTGAGTIIGVIGGYQRGGTLASVSYSARFLRNVALLYQRADRS